MEATYHKARLCRFLAAIFLVALGVTPLARLQTAFSQTKAAWQERWEKVLTEAKKEGTVVVKGPPGETVRNAITDGFKKAFPNINIEYSGGRTGEQAVKLKAERDGGIYSVDVIVGGPTTANFQLKPMGALDPIKPALILPEVTDLNNWRDRRLDFSDNEGLYNLVFSNLVAIHLIYDPRQAKRDEIDELYELLNAKWKGKIVINDPLVSGAGVPWFRFVWEMLGAEKAKDYYRRLRGQAGAVDRDQRRQIEWIAQGKYAILLSPSSPVMDELLERGLKFEVLEEVKDYGSRLAAAFGTVMLINKAPHPNAAIVFLNWLLGKDGQTAWSRGVNNVSRRLDVPTDHLRPFVIPKPGRKYWNEYTEKVQTRMPEEEQILKELFVR